MATLRLTKLERSGGARVQRDCVQDVAERLSQARTEIAGYREDLRKAIDPLEKKNSEQVRARQALNVTKAKAKAERAALAPVARDYHERVIEPNRTTKHAAQWAFRYSPLL